MGTRSSIAVKHGDRIKAVYCHWDGYLDHNGRILLEFYNSVKANRLVALGDLSSLGADIGDSHDFDAERDYVNTDIPTSVHTECTFYGRDRGDEGTEFKSFGSEQEWIAHYDACGAEYYYLIDNGVWYVSDYGNAFKPLHEAIKQQDMEEA